MSASDDRREVAERLRAKYRERNAPGVFVAQDVYMQAYDYLHDLVDCLPDGKSAFTVIADLIDPTCRMTPKTAGSFSSAFLDCSECGQLVPKALPGTHDAYSYCPCCGARVVGGDE